MIEPYVPNRFAQQFSYNQSYVGNPNSGLCFSGNVFEGAQAWYYSVTGGQELFLACLTRHSIVTPASISVRGTSLLVVYLVLEL